jgi:hypothetical protein
LHNVYLKYFCPKNTISCGGFGLLIEYLVVLRKPFPVGNLRTEVEVLTAKHANHAKIKLRGFSLVPQGLERVKFRGALCGQQARHQADESRKRDHAQSEGQADDKEITAHGQFPIPQINRNDLIQADSNQPAEQ